MRPTTPRAAVFLIPILAVAMAAAGPRTDRGGRPAPSARGAPGLDVTFEDAESHAFTEEERSVIETTGRAALAEGARLLPGVPERVALLVRAGDAVVPETGEGGYATAPGHILWTVDPAHAGGVVGVTRARLRATLFHEIHHLVRGWTVQDGTAGTRLIDAAVSEGMATAFERDAAGARPPWAEYPVDEVDGWVDELIAAGGFESYNTYMFQHPDGRRWIGYRAGTYLTDRAMAACDCSAADLVRTPTDEVLALAGR